VRCFPFRNQKHKKTTCVETGSTSLANVAPIAHSPVSDSAACVAERTQKIKRPTRILIFFCLVVLTLLNVPPTLSGLPCAAADAARAGACHKARAKGECSCRPPRAAHSTDHNVLRARATRNLLDPPARLLGSGRSRGQPGKSGASSACAGCCCCCWWEGVCLLVLVQQELELTPSPA